MPPIEFIDPIHDISSMESEPDRNGVWSDISCGNAGDDQPYVHPWVKAIKFPTVNPMWKNLAIK